MRGGVSAYLFIVFPNAGYTQVPSYRRNLDHGNLGALDIPRKIFAITDKRKYSIAFPTHRNRAGENRILYQVPMMLSGVTDSAVIKSVVCNR
jgi:hypothetical protein